MEEIYLDDEGVTSLAAQLQGGLQTSSDREVGDQSRRGRAIRPKVGLGAIFQLMGLPSVDIEGEMSSSFESHRASKASFQIMPENRYASVVAALSGEAAPVRNIDAARLAVAARGGGGVFCDISGWFLPDDDGWLDRANKIGYLVLSDVNNTIKMSMSLAKIRDLRDGSIHPAGHLALRMQGGSNLPIGKRGLNLKVFGRFDGFYLKPLVVFYT